MTQLPTVKVVKDSQRGWHIINVSDFDPERHVVYGEPDAELAVETFGPLVFQPGEVQPLQPGTVHVAPAVHVQDGAPAAPAPAEPGVVRDVPADEPATVTEPVDIPADWRDLHWTKRRSLAIAISGGDEVATGGAADAIIEAELAKRADA